MEGYKYAKRLDGSVGMSVVFNVEVKLVVVDL